MRNILFLLMIVGAGGCSSARLVTLEVDAVTVKPVPAKYHVALRVEK